MTQRKILMVVAVQAVLLSSGCQTELSSSESRALDASLLPFHMWLEYGRQNSSSRFKTKPLWAKGLEEFGTQFKDDPGGRDYAEVRAKAAAVFQTALDWHSCRDGVGKVLAEVFALAVSGQLEAADSKKREAESKAEKDGCNEGESHYVERSFEALSQAVAPVLARKPQLAHAHLQGRPGYDLLYAFVCRPGSQGLPEGYCKSVPADFAKASDGRAEKLALWK